MRNSSLARKIEYRANLFAALGDPTRLYLVTSLTDQKAHSITTLTEGTSVTRQAISKHLTVLEDAGLVSKVKQGRETLYVLEPKPLNSLKEYLEIIGRNWEETLDRLKNFVETDLV